VLDVRPLTDAQIRASFVNCTKGEVKRLRLPVDLDEQRWDDLDFLGWVDPRAPMQSYVVVPTDEALVGIQLRRNVGGKGPKRARMCSICLTHHSGPGVSLMVAPRAGSSGRDGNSVGIDICADLRCSLYVRGLIAAPTSAQTRETLSTEDRVARLQANVETFASRVVGQGA
jgi:hypothetical protein